MRETKPKYSAIKHVRLMVINIPVKHIAEILPSLEIKRQSGDESTVIAGTTILAT